jgi:Na+-transporting NADH:ubiquinone oxidoreductase subunit NqrC
MGEDILSVIFLALICIVIAGIVYRLTPVQMMVPTFALIAVCLWIAYDYILMSRYKAKKACLEQSEELEELDKKIKELLNEADKQEIQDVNEELKLKPEAKHKNEFDIDMYDKELSIQELYKDTGCSGDTRMSNRMKYMGLQPRMSQDIRARWNTEKFRPYFEEELRDNETRDWWDNEAEHLDNLM